MPGGHANINGSDGNTFEKGNKEAEKWTEEIALELGEELIEWISSEGKENMFFGWFFHIEKGLYRDLPQYLCRKFPSFKELYDKAVEIQKLKLIKYGVDDKLNAQMTKFVLSNLHDMADKSENKNEDNVNVRPRISFRNKRKRD